MEKYLILGYEYEDKKLADAAKSEIEMVSRIKSQGNLDNYKIALSVYNKLVEDNVLKTQVGLEFLRTLQKKLLSEKKIDKSEIKPLKIFTENESSKSKNKVIDLYKDRIDTKKAENSAKKYKDQFMKSISMNIVFAIVILSMILIVKYSARFDEQGYKDKIENAYISWENDLKERESFIQKWEIEHGIQQEKE